MAVTPLTPTRRASIDALLAARRVESVPADENRARAFMRKAAVKAVDIPNASRAENRFDLAYGMCHDIGEALLAAYGYRTAPGAGAHEAVGRFLQALLDTPPGASAASKYERLRRIRNNQDYRALPVGRADADLAIHVARDLLAAAQALGVTA